MSDRSQSFDGPGPEEQWFAYLRAGRFMLQRDRRSGLHFFYPRQLAPGSGSLDWEWVEASGRGLVYATSTVARRVERGGDYNVSLIDLAEGPRLMSSVIDMAVEEVRIGLEVTAFIGERDSEAILLFRPTAVEATSEVER